MIQQKFLNSLMKEQILDYIEDHQGFINKAKRGLPFIEAKMIKYPNWKATCPKSGEPLTLDIIKEELQAYLEESEEELKQLQGHLEKLATPVKVKGAGPVQMELGI